ncbi:MAG: hypothetical protein ACW99F_05910 [Candidatus Hodarchaeales archaeon]|jgi:hypothetical protein
MKIEIVSYQPDCDQELLNLFYKSIFYKKKEFEYVRVPNKWISRYNLADNYLIKISKFDGKIIATLGALVRKGKAQGRSVKIACLVDNCILPEYYNKYDEIFYSLLTEIEKECKDEKIDVIQGWDFLKNINRHKNLWKSLGYSWKEGINWFPGGFDWRGEYPINWRTRVNFFWKLVFKTIYIYQRIKEKLLPECPEGVNIRNMEEEDIPFAYDFLKDGHFAEFSPSFSLNEFQRNVKNNNINGLISEKNGRLVGVLTYITSAWSGWMYGKPGYTNNWQIFYTFTPDEFFVSQEFRDTSLPSHMALRLLKLLSPHKQELRKNSYGFIADVFDRELKWRRKAYLKVGCFEPKADFGAIICKSLKSEIEIDTTKIWSLPSRYILAPVIEISKPD